MRSSIVSTRLVQAVRNDVVILLSCNISRDTFSGKSFESNTPFTKRR